MTHERARATEHPGPGQVEDRGAGDGSGRRLLIVPRWAGRPESDYYPWLLARLATEHPGLFAEARVLLLPRPELPDVDAWPAAIAAELQAPGQDAAALEQTYVLAHSVGCQALLRALRGLAPGPGGIGGALCVAGWWQIDRPWDSIRPWLEPMDGLERARAAVRTLRVLLSDNDPFTADHVGNAERWQQLGAGVRLAPGGRHFNNAEEPAVLAALLELVGAIPR